MRQVIVLIICCTLIATANQIPDIHSLTLEEKIGQLFIVATVTDPENQISHDILFKRSLKHVPSIKTEYELLELINAYHIGGVIFLGNSTAEKQYSMTQRLIAHNNQNNQLPLLIALDAEWGAAMRITDAVKFPCNLALGAMHDTDLITEIAQAIGESLHALHVDINFAPVADCNTNPTNPVINRRSFGQDPDKVACCVAAYSKGLQQSGVIACVKHFPGHGDTATDSHTSLPVINKTIEQLRTVELIPFTHAVQQGIDVVMTAHILVPVLDREKPATLSPIVIQTLLRQECKFNGIVATDALDMDAIATRYSPEESTLLALQAGCDLLVAPVDVPRSVAAIKKALADNVITLQQLDEHVERIVAVKHKWICNNSLQHIDPQTAVNNETLIDLSKKAYEKSMTLVKNSGALPISTATKSIVLVDAGTAAESLFTQKIEETYGTCATYLIMQPDIEQTATICKSVRHSDCVIIALQGLTYSKPTYGLPTETISLIKQIARLHKNIVLVLFGNPYALSLFDSIPTILIAYENHPYAQEAAAKVVLGQINPSGKLPVDYN